MILENHDVFYIIIGILLMKAIFTDLKLLVYVGVPIILLYLYKTHNKNKSTENIDTSSANMYVSNYGNSIYYDNTLNNIKKEKVSLSHEIKALLSEINKLTHNPQVLYEAKQMLKIYYQFNPDNYADKGNYIKSLVHQRNKIINHLATLHLSMEKHHKLLDFHINQIKDILEKYITSSPYYNKYYIDIHQPQSYSKNEYSYNIFG